MDQRRTRLGDVIDDYCSRCRLIMNHGVVGMVGGDVKKVRCNTCSSEHEYRQGRLPASRQRKARKLFEEVLKSIPTPETSWKRARSSPAPETSTGAAGDRAARNLGREEPAGGSVTDDQAAQEGLPSDARTRAEAGRPEPTHRRLYTIRRAIAGKDGGKDPKKP